MGTIYQRRPGGPYYGYWSDQRGGHHRRALRTRDQVVARARLRQLELAATDPAAHSGHTLGAAIGDLLAVMARGNAAPTERSYRQKGAHLVRVLGNEALTQVAREQLVTYTQVRAREGASPETVRKELVVMRRALREARDRGLWVGDPRAVVPSVRVRYTPRERWLTAGQLTRLLGELDNGRRLWVALAALAGLRLSEVEGLRWEHVDLRRKRLRAPGRKTPGSWRMLPIHPTLAALLSKAKRGSRSDSVVERWPNVRRDLAAACARLNAKRGRLPECPTVSPNDLRRTFASWLKQRGVDSLVVARLLGHESTRMVELVYGKLAPETFDSAMRAMPRITAPREKRVRKPQGHSGHS